MKVLTVVNSLDIGGIEKTLLSCVPFLKSKGIKVIVCVYNKDGALEKEFVKLGVEILKIKKTKSILLDLLQIYSLLKKHQIDIVHSRFGFSSGGFVLAASFYGIPSIVSYHNTHPGYRSNYILRTVTNISVKLHKWITYNFATKIVGHSKTNLKTNYHDWDSNNKFRLIYNGINFSSFNDYKSKSYDEFSKNYHGKEVLLHIGSFRDQKNHEFLLKVFSKIDPIKNNIFLILIGDGPKKLNLLKLVEDLRIEKNVIFTGAVKDLGKFLSVSDILFFPSKQEGFGNVIAEAQYMNIPICGSDISSMDESIYEDYKKYRFNPYNTEEATFKLKKILKDNKAKLLELSKIRAAEFVNNNFAIDRMANELSNLYIELKKDSVKQKKMDNTAKSILFVANVDWFFISHRLVIAEKAIAKGHKVFVACQDTGRSIEIRKKDIEFIDLTISRSGINPFKEFSTLIDFYKIYSKIKPDIVHHITLKPVIYGSIISKFLKIKHVVNAVSGLGYSFTKNRKGPVQKLMISLLRFGFKRSNLSVIFQNEDDKNIFKNLNIISNRNQIFQIKGSGVDLIAFNKSHLPSFETIKILLPSRMLWDKGVKELREASKMLEAKYKSKIQFILCGLADQENIAGVPSSYLDNWQDGSYVKWIGYKKDMVKVYQDCHIVVLPSYREGMPKALIEACAIGRAIITTNAIGCRECVDEGVNGLKVPVYSSKELAKAIEKLVLNTHLIIEMGENSRKKAEKEFNVNDVVAKHLKIYESI